MQTTSLSMLLKTSTAISSVNVKITAMETTLKCRPCARCITGQLKSINIVQVGLNYLQITVFVSSPRNTCYDSHLQCSLNSQRAEIIPLLCLCQCDYQQNAKNYLTVEKRIVIVVIVEMKKKKNARN